VRSTSAWNTRSSGSGAGVRVMVTGGTGFFGGHITEALLAAGHQPRLLVHDPEKLGRMCALFHIEPELVEAVVGDILDPTSVADALDSCDACVHSAAFATLNPELMPKALEVNAPGTRIVLDAAMAVGCDPIVHVSTLSVIFPPTGSMFSADDPVHAGGMPSKRRCATPSGGSLPKDTSTPGGHPHFSNSRADAAPPSKVRSDHLQSCGLLSTPRG